MSCYIGTFCHAPALDCFEILHKHAIIVDESGFISSICAQDDPVVVEFVQSRPNSVTVLPPFSFILPTFVDLHLHAPQFTFLGNGLHLPLMQWLDEYAYRAEEELDADPALARKVYSRLARRLIEYGTGAALLFGTLEENTNLILAEVFQTVGLRAFVGKLHMNITGRPKSEEKSAEASVEAGRSFISRCRGLVSHLPAHERLVHPVITPRFVPTCSDELLTGLGALAAETGAMIQSHLAEAHDQVKWVQATRRKDDMDVFEQHGLMTERTVQAHCTFLSGEELRRVAERGTKIAHCPLSNAYFSAEMFPLREALEAGVEVGLGSDCAGGYALDMLHAMRSAVATARIREGQRVLRHERDTTSRAASVSIDWKEALFLCTRGGAAALGLESGVFRVGAPFDAQCIHTANESGEGIGALDFFVAPPDSLDEATIEKWWCLGDTRNRRAVWVQGKQLQL